MAIRSFSVGPQRGLLAASADSLPNIVAISGANGSGKSTLLELLWQQRHSLLEAGSEALYVGPNRAWRAGSLSSIAVLGFDQDYEQVLKAEQLPSFNYVAPGGNNWLSGQARFGSNADDAQALVKSSIVRMQNSLQSYVTEQFRRQGGAIERGTVPDLLEPLRSLVSTLLPHLKFVRVDTTNANNLQVLFAPVGADELTQSFDIDQLSSGEKAAVALFLPFIERQMKRLMHEAGAAALPGVVPLTVIIDEPEIHLHPLLQVNMLEYMRNIAKRDEAQFILTTHSPTMLDALEPEELFVLSPATMAPDNQLSRLSDSIEKLEVARTVTGSTHLLTRSKPIVFLEGEPDNSKTASDERLLRLLIPQVEHWALVAAHGRGQVVRAVQDLRSAELKMPGQAVFGLIDGDQNANTGDDHVVAWPVAMVENLLLDPHVIAAVLSPYTSIARRNQQSIAERLNRIVTERRDAEVELRIKSRLPTSTLRPYGKSAADVLQSATESFDVFVNKMGKIDVADIVSTAETEVDSIVQNGKELDRFHGKQILRALYDEMKVSDAGLGWNAFLTELARSHAGSERLGQLTNGPISQVRLYFPQDLVEVLEQCPESEQRNQLIDESRSERQAWETGRPDGAGREGLRARLLNFARELRASGDVDLAQSLTRSAVKIGTPS